MDILIEHRSAGTGVLKDSWTNNKEIFLNKWKTAGLQFPIKVASRRKINGMKQIVILDECDGASAQLMKGLRSAIEEFHNSCRFILTCNNVNSIIPPLRSRCQEFNFNMNKEEFRNEMIPKVVKRVGLVLKSESIEFDQEAVDLLVKERYPDIRKIYGILQQYSKMNGLIDKNVLNFVDVDDKLYELVLTKKLTLARQYILDAG